MKIVQLHAENYKRLRTVEISPDGNIVTIGGRNGAGKSSILDAIYVALGGADGVNFLTQYQQAGGSAPLIGGSITVDQTVLGTKGKQRDYVVGTPSAGPIADNSDDPAWKKFVGDYKAAFKDGFPSPSLFAQGYYINTKAVLLALDKVGGDLSGGEAKFRSTLAALEFDTPTGKVKLDKNRQAIADNYLTNPIARASETMAKCSQELVHGTRQMAAE